MKDVDYGEHTSFNPDKNSIEISKGELNNKSLERGRI